jgi:hypothetical protein
MDRSYDQARSEGLRNAKHDYDPPELDFDDPDEPATKRQVETIRMLVKKRKIPARKFQALARSYGLAPRPESYRTLEAHLLTHHLSSPSRVDDR